MNDDDGKWLTGNMGWLLSLVVIFASAVLAFGKVMADNSDQSKQIEQLIGQVRYLVIRECQRDVHCEIGQLR